MRNAIVLIVLLILSSCNSLITRSIQRSNGVGIAIQSFAASCCGGCGQSVVIDSLNGVQHVLHVECDFAKGCCRACMFGTEKIINKYSGKFIVQQSRFRPVYDTVALKKMFPGIRSSVYFDPVLLNNSMMPLTTMDSMLISRAINDTTVTNCDRAYLSLLIGFVFVKTEPVKFKNTIRFKPEK